MFTTVTSHEPLKDTLRQAAVAARRIAAGTPQQGDTTAMTHSWLFTGPPGSGRSAAARALAQAFVCVDPDTVGCGHCRGCTTAAADSHADVIHIVPTETVISVATMREVIYQAHSRPSVANWRVVVIEDADRLSIGAANALLKTVEEPPARTVIMLCAPSDDPADIAVTLTSRCRRIYVPTPSIDDVVAQLTKNPAITPAQAQVAAAAAACHIGRARHLATSEQARARRDAVLSIAGNLRRGAQVYTQVSRLVKIIEDEADQSLAPKEERELEKLKTILGTEATGKIKRTAMRGNAAEIKQLEEKQKKRRKRFHTDAVDMALVDLASVFRDALATVTGAAVDPMNPDKQQLVQDLSQGASAAQLIDCLDAITVCRETLTFNTGAAIALDAMIGRMRIALHLDD